MKRVVASGLGVGIRGLAVLGAAALLAACAPPQATLEEEAPPQHAAVESSEDVTNVSVAEQPGDADVLLVRELKIIDDNGQQGVFAKLNRPPQDVSHVLLTNPNRLLIEISGPTGENVVAERYAVENPMVSQVQIGSDPGKIRLTLMLKGDQAPVYTVDDLKDTVVAFLGEPKGTDQPVHESIVFTQRAIPGVAAAPVPVAAVARPSTPPVAVPVPPHASIAAAVAPGAVPPPPVLVNVESTA